MSQPQVPLELILNSVTIQRNQALNDLAAQTARGDYLLGLLQLHKIVDDKGNVLVQPESEPTQP